MRPLISGHRRFIAATATAALLTVFGIWGVSMVWQPILGPSYRGRSLRWWADRLDPADPTTPLATRHQAEEAVQATGSNAIPILLSWLGHNDSWMERRLVDMLKSKLTMRSGLKSPLGWFCETHYHYRSLLAFQALGPVAESAVPSLEAIITKDDPRTSQNAALALALVAPDEAERVAGEWAGGSNAKAARWVSEALARVRTPSAPGQLGLASRNNPVRPQTNSTSAAAGPGR